VKTGVRASDGLIRRVIDVPPEVDMEIDKRQIVELLKAKGDHDQAAKAEKELPDRIDPEKDTGMLIQFGIDPAELMGNLGRGGFGKILGG
jgi:hypothetical protein